MDKLSKSTPKINLDDLINAKSLPVDELLKNPKRKRGPKKKRLEDPKKVEVIINKDIIIDNNDMNDELVKDLKKLIKEYNDSKKVEKEVIVLEDNNTIKYPPSLTISFE